MHLVVREVHTEMDSNELKAWPQHLFCIFFLLQNQTMIKTKSEQNRMIGKLTQSQILFSFCFLFYFNLMQVKTFENWN